MKGLSTTSYSDHERVVIIKYIINIFDQYLLLYVLLEITYVKMYLFITIIMFYSYNIYTLFRHTKCTLNICINLNQYYLICYTIEKYTYKQNENKCVSSPPDKRENALI